MTRSVVTGNLSTQMVIKIRFPTKRNTSARRYCWFQVWDRNYIRRAQKSTSYITAGHPLNTYLPAEGGSSRLWEVLSLSLPEQFSKGKSAQGGKPKEGKTPTGKQATKRSLGYKQGTDQVNKKEGKKEKKWYLAFFILMFFLKMNH